MFCILEVGLKMKQKSKKTGTFFARIFKQTLATLLDSFIILIFLITFWRAEKSNSTDLLEQSFNMFYTILAKGILLVILTLSGKKSPTSSKVAG